MLFSNKYNRQDFINFFSVDFLPEDFIAEPQTIDFDFKSKYFKTDGVTYIGKSESLDLAVYEIKHSSENDARIGLSRDAFKLVSNYFENNALVLFVPEKENNYRLSLVTIEHKLDTKGVRVLKEYSNPKRYSYFLGEDAKTHTPEQYLLSLGRVTDIDDLKKRFSVEVVNKEFYSKVAGMFSKLVGGKRKRGSKTVSYEPQLRLPSYPVDRFEKKYKEFAVRLIGRTVFCWFLKKKKSDKDIPLIPEDVLSHFAVNMYPDYYHSRVEPLFFEVLNTQTEKRKPEYKEKPYHTIPFLNGGLFEPHHDDFYITGKPNYALKVPDEWWKEFIEILETYNFTIDENTSIDIDLSVDPEMLGRIFENLLAEINPETGETARKSTGSYYTPRPIVEYMVDESLKQHIITKTNLPEDKIAPLLDYSIEESGLTGEEENLVKTALDDIKVLDPACGSGAFPMGILQKMLLILQKVDYSAENSIRNILKDIKDPMYRKLFEAKLMEDDDLDDYARKLNIIRRSIYGIDIQPIATEISKLRFFLSIIVDEKIQDDQKNRGIEPLPNLEFKFVCANTLIPLPPNRELFENADTIEELEKLREEYFLSYGNDKKELRKEFEKIQRKLFTDANINLFTREVGEHNIEKQTQSSLLANWKPFGNESTPWFDAKWMFGVESGFDIILGNPPYIRIDNIDLNLRESVKKIYKSCKGKFDIYYSFYEKSMSIASNNGSVCFITPNRFTATDSGYLLRDKILKSFQSIIINSVSNISVFANASTYPAIVALQGKNEELKNVVLKESKDYKELTLIEPHNVYSKEEIFKYPKFILPLNSNRKILDIYTNKLSESNKLKDYLKIQEGLRIPGKIESSQGKYHIVKQFQFKRFSKIKIGSYLTEEDAEGSLNFKTERLKNCLKPKILIAEDGLKIEATYDDSKSICQGGIYFGTTINSGINLFYILGVLNSKLLSVLYKNLFSGMHMGGGYLRYRSSFLYELPIIYLSIYESYITELVYKILEKSNNKDCYAEYENELNIAVYKLYSLTYGEVLIVDPEFGMSEEEYENFEVK